MKRLFLFGTLFAAASCAKHVTLRPPQPCEYVTAAPGVTPTPCAQVRELFEAAQRCYTANVDPAVARIQLEDVVVVRMPADGVTDSGSPWIWAPDGTKVYGYFSPDFNFIGYHFAPVLLHEVHAQIRNGAPPGDGGGDWTQRRGRCAAWRGLPEVLRRRVEVSRDETRRQKKGER